MATPPLTPEQLAAQSYYGTPGVNMSGGQAAPAVDVAGYYGPPPPPPVDAPPMYDYGAASTGLQEVAPPPPPKPFSWNAPGYENVSTQPFAGAPAAPTRPDGVTAREVQPEVPAASVRQPISQVRETPAAAPRRTASSGGGGGPAGSSADAKLLATYDAEEQATRSRGAAEREAGAKAAGMRQDLAQRQMAEADIHAIEMEKAQKGFDADMASMRKQVDEVRAKKVDPGRLMRQDGMGITAVLGGLFGGMYMGLNKLDKNPFLEDLNKQIDRDIAAQEKDIDTAQRGVGDRMNLLREQRATFKDNELAKLQTRNLVYAATERSIEAEIAKSESPIQQAKMEQGLAGLSRERATLEKQIDDKRKAMAAAQASAGFAAQKAQQAEMRKAYEGTFEKALAAGLAPAAAEQEANRMVANLFAGGAGARPAAAEGAQVDPVSAVPKGQQQQAMKEQEESSKAESAIANIRQQFADFKRTGFTSPKQLAAFRAGIAGNYKAGLGPGMSSDKDFETFIAPQIPDTMNADDTLDVKLRNIESTIRSKIATPTLDRHSPGWKGPAPVKQTKFGD